MITTIYCDHKNSNKSQDINIIRNIVRETYLHKVLLLQYSLLQSSNVTKNILSNIETHVHCGSGRSKGFHHAATFLTHSFVTYMNAWLCHVRSSVTLGFLG